MDYEDFYQVEMTAGDYSKDLQIKADDKDAAIDVAWETVEEMRCEGDFPVASSGIDVTLTILNSPNEKWSAKDNDVINPEAGHTVTWHLDPEIT